MPITVRHANLKDIPSFVEAGRLVHDATRYHIYDYDTRKVANTLQGIVENPQGGYCFIIAEDGSGQPVGWVIGCVERHFFSDQVVASVINYGVMPDRRMSGAGLKLLTAFRKWAENRGAFELCAGVNSGVDIEKMDRFLKKLGFRLTGGNYAILLQPTAAKV